MNTNLFIGLLACIGFCTVLFFIYFLVDSLITHCIKKKKDDKRKYIKTDEPYYVVSQKINDDTYCNKHDSLYAAKNEADQLAKKNNKVALVTEIIQSVCYYAGYNK